MTTERSVNRRSGSFDQPGINATDSNPPKRFSAPITFTPQNVPSLDFHLPGMSGLDLQRLLETMGHPVPIIFVSASYPEFRDEAIDLGRCGRLRQTVRRLSPFLAALRSALEYSQL